MDVREPAHDSATKLLWWDTETNGPLPPRCGGGGGFSGSSTRMPTAATLSAYPRLVQLAFTVKRGGIVLERYVSYVNHGDAGHVWSDQAQAANGIPPERVEAGVPTVVALCAFLSAVDRWKPGAVVAHNAHGFDVPVMAAEAIRCGIQAQWQAAMATSPPFDTMLARLDGTGRWRKLKDLYELLCGQPWSGATLHDAGADVDCLIAVYEAAVAQGMIKHVSGMPVLTALSAQQRCAVMKRNVPVCIDDALIGFGEHAALTFSSLWSREPEYCERLLSERVDEQNYRMMALKMYLLGKKTEQTAGLIMCKVCGS